jgi:thiol-disulfide isomerase/thioredoxin
VVATGGVAVVVALVIGLSQTPKPERIRPLTAAELRTAIKGAPAPLAALNAEGSQLLPGGRPALLRRIDGLRGYPVVVNVWASWCPPCRLESELFQRVAIQYGAHVAFIGVDSNDSDAAARTFLRSTPLTYPSFRDRPQAEANALHLQGLPGTLFLDPRGRRIYLHQGQYLSLDALRRDVQRLL